MLTQIWNELSSPEKWVVIVWMAAIAGAILMHISGVIMDHVLDPYKGHSGAMLTIAYFKENGDGICRKRRTYRICQTY